MRIAIPLADGKLAMHFGHCERFALVDIDQQKNMISSREDIVPPRTNRDFCHRGLRSGVPR